MATHLSWTGYFVAVGAAVVIYYVIIGIRCYRQDIRALLNSKSRFWDRPEKPPPVSPPQATQPKETAEPVEVKKQHSLFWADSQEFVFNVFGNGKHAWQIKDACAYRNCCSRLPN